MAAGNLIVEEAGGRVTDYANRPVDLFHGKVVASNGKVHDAMIEVITRAERT